MAGDIFLFSLPTSIGGRGLYSASRPETCRIDMKARLSLAALLAVTLLLAAAPARPPAGAPYRILIVYAGSSPESTMWRDAVTWIYGTVWRLPVDWFDASQRANDTWLAENLHRYTLVFLLEAPEGLSRLSPRAWEAIRGLDGNTSYVAFGLEVNDPNYAALFGATMARRVKAGQASATPELQSAGLPPVLGLSGYAYVARLRGGRALATTGSGAVAVARGGNLWLGVEELGRGDYPYRPWLFSLARYILGLPGRPLAVAVNAERLLALRIDDFPFSTESWYFHWQYFSDEGYERFYRVLERHGAKVSYAVIPFNVSKKDGSWVSYDRIFPRRVELAVEWSRRGVVELLDHGATHVTPYQEFYMEAPSDDPYAMTRSIVYEFGYEPHLHRHIPYSLQLAHLKAGIGEIERWTGSKVEGFVPPWHVWDRETERALAVLGVWYISADFRFQESLGRPRSAPGLTTPYGQVYVPETHSWTYAERATPRELRRTLGAFLDNGVPVVLLSHGRNWSFHSYREEFTVSGVDETLGKLEEALHPRYATVGEIASRLRAWNTVRIEEHWNGTGLVVVVEAGEPVTLRLEPVGFRAAGVYLDGRPTAATLTLRPGRHVVYVEAARSGEGQEALAPVALAVILALFAVLSTLSSLRGAGSRGGARRSG